MLCGPRRTVCHSGGNGYLDGVATVETFVYLGVTIDKKLNFEKYLGATIQKVNGRLITLARIRKLIDAHTCLLIYKQTILPILDYVSVLANSSTHRKIGLSLRWFLICTTHNIHFCAIIKQYFSYTDKREVLQQEYSQPQCFPLLTSGG